MTPGEHYQRAVELLTQAEVVLADSALLSYASEREQAALLLAAAQVHAKLSGI